MLNIVEQSGSAPDALELSLEASERLMSQIRARQIEAIRVLDTEQVAARDGARSIQDWVAARLDVSTETARELVTAAKLLEEHASSAAALAAGDMSFDRALATAPLAVSGAETDVVSASAGYDIAGVRRLTSRRHRITTRSEQEAFAEQYVALQPSLDKSWWKLSGGLTAMEGHVFDQALVHRSEQLPAPVAAVSRGQRNAHALVAMAQDSLNGGPDGTSPVSVPVVSVFVDADLAAPTRGEAGAEIAAGPRIGPATLERLLCEGRIQLITLRDLKPVAASPAVRAIPAATRRFVLWRDGGCVIDGCSSRYRLQPHHITPYSEGGNHDPDNLATLCWYHHHVAIHGTGYRLDANTPPQRRKLIPPTRSPP